MFRGLLTLLVLPALGLAAFAQEPSFPPKKLTLKAAAAPVPALKYRLLPEVAELEPGNALLCYMRAGRWTSKQPSWQEMEKWEEMPLEQLKKEKVDTKLPMLALEEVDRGARRTRCDWEVTAQIRKEGITIASVKDAQVIREFVSWLRLRVRWEIANGQLDKALYSVQTMLAISRHLETAPSLVYHLVGVAVAAIAMNSVEELIQQPGAPNLYWALTALPRSFLDIAKAMEGEKIWFDVLLPEVRKMEKEPLSAEELAHLAKTCCDINSAFDKNRQQPDLAKKLELVGKVARRYPAARQALIDQGRKPDEIDALAMLQVVVMVNYQEFQRVRDNVVKWCYVPFAEGIKGRKLAVAECEQKWATFPFGAIFPALERVLEANVRTDRRIAALRCIEALRMHLAATGKVPPSLADITMVPVPLDPATGAPFQYAARGDVVTLVGPVTPGANPIEGNAITYAINLVK